MNIWGKQTSNKPKGYKVISAKEQIYQCEVRIYFTVPNNTIESEKEIVQFKLNWFLHPQMKNNQTEILWVKCKGIKSMNFLTEYFMRYEVPQLYPSIVYVDYVEWKKAIRKEKLERILNDQC